jgi:tRNA threonylcarbamoyl adenosine modification protein YjeE
MTGRPLYEIDTTDEAGTEAAAARIVADAWPGEVIGLVGDLGAGKTVFVRGAVRGLGGDPDQVHSPTFTLMYRYDARLPVFHWDLYRLGQGADLDGIGFHDLADEGAVSLVEWADRFAEMAGEVDRWVFIGIDGDSRHIRVFEARS